MGGPGAHGRAGAYSFSLWAEALERHLHGLPAEEVAQLCGLERARRAARGRRRL